MLREGLCPYVPGLCPFPAASSALSVAAAQDCEETLARKDADIEQAHRKVSAAPLMAYAACCHGCIAHRNAGLARLPSTRSCAHVRGHQALHIPIRRASSSGSLAAADPTRHDPIACHSVWRPRPDLHGIGLTPCLTRAASAPALAQVAAVEDEMRALLHAMDRHKKASAAKIQQLGSLCQELTSGLT